MATRFRPLAGINCNSKTDSFSFAILVYHITFCLFLTVFFYFGTYFFFFSRSCGKNAVRTRHFRRFRPPVFGRFALTAASKYSLRTDRRW